MILKSLHIHSTCIRYLALFLGTLCLFPACGEKQQLRKALRDFQAATITFPDKMLVMENGIPRDSIIRQTGYRFIVYTAPDECSSCRIQHISEDEDLFKFAREEGLDLYVIFSYDSEEDSAFFRELALASHLRPLWVDTQGEFFQMNESVIPKDPRFHYFLLTPDGHPVIVGNPANNNVIKKLIFNFFNYENQK